MGSLYQNQGYLPRRRKLHIACDDFFMLRSKSHLALIPLLLLSESNPLCWALIRFHEGGVFVCHKGWGESNSGAVVNDVPGARQSRDPGRRARRLRFSPSPPRRRKLHIACDDFFMLRSKSHLALIPPLLLSEAKPLCRALLCFRGGGVFVYRHGISVFQKKG